MINVAAVILENEKLKTDNENLTRKIEDLSLNLSSARTTIEAYSSCADRLKATVDNLDDELCSYRAFARCIACKITPTYSQILYALTGSPVNASTAIGKWVTNNTERGMFIVQVGGNDEDDDDIKLVSVEFEDSQFYSISSISKNELVWIIQ